MKHLLIIVLLLSAIFSANAQSYIYKGRQDTVPCTMIVTSLFATDGFKVVKDADSVYGGYLVANIYQIRGYMITPEHPSDPFYLDENKKRISLLHVWLSYPYNFHAPSNKQ